MPASFSELYAWAYKEERKVFDGDLAKYLEAHGDVAMECLLEAAEKAAACGRGAAAQKGLLCLVARHRFADYLRRVYGTKVTPEGKRHLRKREMLVDPQDWTIENNAIDEPSSEDQLIRAEELKRQLPDPAVVADALRRAHGEQDYLLFALMMEGLSSEQIGKRLGLSAANVRQRWARRKQAFASTLAQVLGWDVTRVLSYLNQPNHPKRCHKTGDVAPSASLGDEKQ